MAASLYRCMLITGYKHICHFKLPSMAATWLFNRPWSGFGGSGGGVFGCLMSDSLTAPVEVCWQKKKKARDMRDIAHTSYITWQVCENIKLFVLTLFWRLCIPLPLTFTGICLSISGLKNGGWMWMTAFLQGLAVYLVSQDKDRQQNKVSLKV